MQTRWDQFALSVRPKCYKKETQSLQSHLGETKVTIGFVAVAMSSETRWRRIDQIGGAEFDIQVQDICGCEKVVEGFGAYHKVF